MQDGCISQGGGHRLGGVVVRGRGKLLMQWISPYSVKDSCKVFRNVIILQSNLEESQSEKLTFSKISVKFFGRICL